VINEVKGEKKSKSEKAKSESEKKAKNGKSETL
jgi:hypothetical protein